MVRSGKTHEAGRKQRQVWIAEPSGLPDPGAWHRCGEEKWKNTGGRPAAVTGGHCGDVFGRGWVMGKRNEPQGGGRDPAQCKHFKRQIWTLFDPITVMIWNWFKHKISRITSLNDVIILIIKTAGTHESTATRRDLRHHVITQLLRAVQLFMLWWPWWSGSYLRSVRLQEADFTNQSDICSQQRAEHRKLKNYFQSAGGRGSSCLCTEAEIEAGKKKSIRPDRVTVELQHINV